MRLLCTKTLELAEFGEQKIEHHEIKYAILSHGWGDNELSFQDMQSLDDEKRMKDGYKKIDLFCEKVYNSGHNYAWIDTCCINKESSAELSEAINSMFYWYQMAEICYAYLNDVPSGEEMIGNIRAQRVVHARMDTTGTYCTLESCLPGKWLV